MLLGEVGGDDEAVLGGGGGGGGIDMLLKGELRRRGREECVFESTTNLNR